MMAEPEFTFWSMKASKASFVLNVVFRGMEAFLCFRLEFRQVGGLVCIYE